MRRDSTLQYQRIVDGTAEGALSVVRKAEIGDRARSARARGLSAVAILFGSAAAAFAQSAAPALSPTNIFAPMSTPAQSIFDLSLFVLTVTAAIFLVVFILLAYAVVKFRKRADDGHEPAQVYGSTQLELAWTVIPILIVVVLFLATARVIAGIQNANHPTNAIDVTVIGHQFWWEYRYPSLNVVTANELHIPLSDPAHPTRIRPEYDVDDHLHPNDAGYRAMGDAVDLNLFQ